MKDINSYEMVPTMLKKLRLDNNGFPPNLTTKIELALALQGMLYKSSFSKDLFIESAMNYLLRFGSNHKDDKSRLLSAKFCFTWMKKNDFLKVA